MKKLFFVAALVLAAAVSCTKEFATDEVISVEVTPEGYVPVTLNAKLDVTTKTVLDGNKIQWEVGEELAVFADGAGDPLKFTVVECYTISSYVGVTFSGNIPEGTKSLIAAYPYQKGMKCVDGVVTMEIPAEQTIPAGLTYDPKALPSVAFFSTLESSPVFRNVMSVVTFNVGETENVGKVNIYYKGDAKSAGPIEVSIAGEEVIPEVANKCDTYTTVVAEGGFAPETTYMVVVAPAVSAGVCAIAYGPAKAGVRESENELALERNKGKNLGNITENAVWQYYQITNAEELAEFLVEAEKYPEAWETVLANDIDMSGAEIVPAVAYYGSFDGCGHSLRNWECKGTPLFTTLYGAAKNINIDSSCKMVSAEPGRTGFIAGALEGTIENCHNAGEIDIYLESDTIVDGETVIEDAGIASRQIGAIVGRMTNHSAQLIDCSNSGNVTVTENIVKEMAGTTYVGGLVGLVGDPGDEVVVRLNNCSNTGNVTVNAVNADPTQAWLNSHFVGGVAGATGVNKGDKDAGITSNFTKYYGEIRNCVNEGSVSVNWNGGTGGYFRVGGVFGYAEAALFDCVNKGAVSYVNTSTEATNASPVVGGISSVVAGTAPINAMNCVNEGKVSMTGLVTTAASTYGNGIAGSSVPSCGGCFGLAGDQSTLIDNCDNKGTVDVNMSMKLDAGTKFYVGGVVGTSMAEIKNCDNSGSINAVCLNKELHVGGIVANTTKSVSSCSCSAPIVVRYDVSDTPTEDSSSKSIVDNYYNNVGGIVGYINRDVTLSDCSVSESASLDVESNGQMRVGGIVGMSYATLSGNTSAANIKIRRVGERGARSFMGGVAGMQNVDLPVSECSNAGNLDVQMGALSAKSYLAGVCGYIACNSIKDCYNTGAIVVDCNEMVKQMYVAGITSWYNVKATFENLTNSGDITLTNLSNAASYNYIGGISGGQNAGSNTFKNLVNSGNIVCDAPARMRIGGIGAQLNTAAAVENCSNSGNITVSNATAEIGAALSTQSEIGGICGYWGNGGVKNVSNTGTITCTNCGQSGVGGLTGVSNVNFACEGLTLSGAITTDDTCYAGYIMGAFYSTKKKLTVNKPFEFTGTVNGAEPTEENAVGYLNGGSVAFDKVLGIETLWLKQSAESSAWNTYYGGTGGTDRNIAMDDDYVYIAESSATAKLWAISIEDPTDVTAVNVEGVTGGGAHALTCPRVIKNTDANVNGGKDVLVCCSLTRGDADPVLYMWNNGIASAPKRITLTTYAASSWYGDTFTVYGTLQDGVLLFDKTDSAGNGIVTFLLKGVPGGDNMYLWSRIKFNDAMGSHTGVCAYYPFPGDLNHGVYSPGRGTEARGKSASVTGDITAEGAKDVTLTNLEYAEGRNGFVLGYNYIEWANKRYVIYGKQPDKSNGSVYVLEGASDADWLTIINTPGVKFRRDLMVASGSLGSGNSAMDVTARVIGDNLYFAAQKQNVACGVYRLVNKFAPVNK